MTAPELLERPSPNCGPRRDGAGPDMVLIHYTGMESAEAALARLCDPEAQVSAHYLLAEDGRIWRLVEESSRAWHAGAGSWGSIEDVNSRSIGIELANPGPLADFPPFPAPQMVALEALLDGIMSHWRIPPARVLGHSDTAPGRKTDPGPKFDWRRLALGGRAVWPGPAPDAPATPEAFRSAATRAGYGTSDTEATLDAVRLRFRPWARGAPLSAEDVAVLAGLPAA